MGGQISIDAIERDIDQLNADILALLVRGKDLAEDAAESLTDEALAAGAIVAMQPDDPGELPVFDPDGSGTLLLNKDGSPVNAGRNARPAGWVAPATPERVADVRKRLELVSKLVKLLDEPIGNAARSYAQQLRAGGGRWRAG